MSVWFMLHMLSHRVSTMQGAGYRCSSGADVASVHAAARKWSAAFPIGPDHGRAALGMEGEENSIGPADGDRRSSAS